MNITVSKNKNRTGADAADKGAELIKAAIKENGSAAIVLATGTSQFEMLSSLIQQKGIDWSKVTVFHLDEYIGLSAEHPASFRKYLKERFADKIPNLKKFHYINGENSLPAEECSRLGQEISGVQIDTAFIGIGENGHLAFNDPPADFETEEPYIIVKLDEACRLQQLGEGWFSYEKEVPVSAISMSVRQIMKSRSIIVTVPDRRKAVAVQSALEGEINKLCPASILQSHPDCSVFLDPDSASKLTKIL